MTTDSPTEKIELEIERSINVIRTLDKYELFRAAILLLDAIKRGHKILVCGNGGSAADAQHFTGELVNKLRTPREPIPAIALTGNSSNITSIANDTSYAAIFSRQIAALGNESDVLVAFSTSGRSANIIQACQKAVAKKMDILLFLGRVSPTSLLFQFSPFCIIVNSTDTPYIQQAHEVAFHIICQLIDDQLTKSTKKGDQND